MTEHYLYMNKERISPESYLKINLKRLLDEINNQEAKKNYVAVWGLVDSANNVLNRVKNVYRDNYVVQELLPPELHGPPGSNRPDNLTIMKMHILNIIDAIGMEIIQDQSKQTPAKNNKNNNNKSDNNQ